MLASINPSASPIWPSTGLALAAVLLRGYRVWPAILVAAFAANVTTAGYARHRRSRSASATRSKALLGRLPDQSLVRTARRPSTARPASPASRCSAFLPTAVGATIGVTSLAVGGLVGTAELGLGLADLVARRPRRRAAGHAGDRAVGGGGRPQRSSGRKLFESIVIFCVACAIGLIAFSPLFETAERAGAARLPRGAAAVVVGAAARPARHRDRRAGAGGLRGLGHACRQRAVRPRDPQRIVPAAADVHDRRDGAEPRAQRRRRRAPAHRGRAARRPRRAQPAGRRAHRRRSPAPTCALQDEVDRRKRVESELDQQTRHLVEAQRLANLGSWVRNLETDKIVWSDQLYEIFGVQPGEELAGIVRRLSQAHPSGRPRAGARAGAGRDQGGPGLPRRAADRAAERRDPPRADLRRGDQERSRPRGAACTASASTSPSASRPRSRSSARASSSRRCRRWRRSASSPAASRTTSTIS